jgi:four helix bundle protein
MRADHFTDLPAWQACNTFKKATFELCATTPLAHDDELRGELQRAAFGPTGRIAEGFRRSDPATFTRLATMARSLLIDARRHVQAARTRGYITDEIRIDLEQLVDTAVDEVARLMKYLRSPRAQLDAKRRRERARQGRNPPKRQ